MASMEEGVTKLTRMTRRNYYGIPYVPGYAPICHDTSTCELITRMCERLALLEDILMLPTTDKEKKKEETTLK